MKKRILYFIVFFWLYSFLNIQSFEIDTQTIKKEAYSQLIFGIKTANSTIVKQALLNGADLNMPYGLDQATPLMLIIDELHRYCYKFSERQLARILHGIILIYYAKHLSWFIPYIFLNEFKEKKKVQKTDISPKLKKTKNSEPYQSIFTQEIQNINYNSRMHYLLFIFAGYQIISGVYHTAHYYAQKETAYKKVNELTLILQMLINNLELNTQMKDILGRTVFDRMAQYEWHLNEVEKIIKLLKNISKRSDSRFMESI